MYEQKEETPKTGFEKLSSVLGAVGGFIFESIEAVVVTLAICVVLYLFLVTPHEVVGSSMFPNFKNGEHLIANKLIYRFKEPQRGDVVIFKHSPTQDFIKRIIGVPGDEVGLIDGQIYVNGEQLSEDYLDPTIFTGGGGALAEGETVSVPEGQYFVLGDNRPHSTDSRAFGPIKKEDIKGKAWVVYFPFNQFRVVEHPEYN